jgi:glyoxylase-like metal-dependent hydrolase (beta-lactamase superfamily II)
MIRSIQTIHSGYFKLDGGAMFGVVPKTLWSRLSIPDANNLCTWSFRCLLIETESRKILVDCGMGDKQDPKFKSFYEPHGNTDIIIQLQNKGIDKSEITDVFLTHLHFDHCGGAVIKNSEGKLVPAFPNATYWSNKQHWNWAMNPNEREKNSFLKENFVPLMEHECLQFIDISKNKTEWLPSIAINTVFGHTEAMMVLEMEYQNQQYIYCADLLPSSFHISMPYIMAYDVRPLVSLQEKEILLKNAVEKKQVLIFEHDPKIAAATVKYDEKGRIVADTVIEI